LVTTDKLRVELRQDEQVLALTLNAPKANILDAEMMGGIVEALETHGKSTKLKAIVFDAEGKHFSFGASVPEHTKDRCGDMLAQFHGMFRKLLEVAVPTCAVVRGQCLGGATELVSYCSYVFAAPGAMLGQPEINLAVIAPVASVLLPWRIGGGHALDLCVSGRSIAAEVAASWGLVHEVADDPAAACNAFVEKELLPKSASSLRFAERAARFDLSKRFAEQIPAIERMYVDELMATHDANEGIESFLAKRKPTFDGT
jgi:cyclohexa-1,5-dienecarbonyl-CoA hydratase